MCPSFCGQDKACCRRGDSSPAECKGSTGFVDFAYTQGSSRDYHQCVQPGPAAAFKIKQCGEVDLNGLWVRTGVKSGSPRYALVDNPYAIMEWSPSRGQWELYHGRSWFGRVPILFASSSDSKTFPTSGWRAVDGVGPEPRIEIFEKSDPASLLQETSLEGSLVFKRSADYGTHEAMCDSDEELEKIGHWCVRPCPAGHHAKNGNTCVQICGGGMPADSWGMCGTSSAEIHAAVAETAAMVGNGAIKSYILIDDMNKTGVDGDKLARTINTFVDMGKPFAHPTCPEFVDA